MHCIHVNILFMCTGSLNMFLALAFFRTAAMGDTVVHPF